MLDTEFVINTQNLSKSYGEIDALKSLNLQVPKGSIFGFLGPNGAGKTTTIKLLLGLAKPTSGSGSIFGLDIVRDSVAIREHIGFLAQDPRFYEYMTARETLRFKAKFYFQGPASLIEERVDESLALVGLSDKADRPIRGFSGGERQRLGIAQAQVNLPDLLVLDEPAASLDPLGRRDVLEVMEGLRKHTTIFYSTHILDDVQQVSDAAAILNKGRLVAQAPIEELISGQDGIVYSLIIEGDANPALAKISKMPWVSRINSDTGGDQTIIEIAVTNEKAAKAQLLRLVLESNLINVAHFGRKTYELEDIFVDLVEGGNGG